MANSDNARLLVAPGKPSSQNSSSASSIKSNKSGRLSSWLHGKKERIKDKIGETSHRSHSNTMSPTESVDLAVNRLSVAQAPCEQKPDLVIQPALSLHIFPTNTTRTVNMELPKIGQRIEDIAQLIHCTRLLQSLSLRPLPTHHRQPRSRVHHHCRQHPSKEMPLDCLSAGRILTG